MGIIKLIFLVPFLFLIQIILMLLGFIVVPIALLLNRIEKKEDCTNETSNPNHKFKDKWIDKIWGNNDDGIDGDIYYLKNHVNHKRNFFTRFNWVLFRNPVHNFSLLIGYNGKCKNLKGFTKLSYKKEYYKWNCSSACNYENLLDTKKEKQGYEYIEVNKYPMFRLRLKYPFLNKGIKINYGWKNWNCDKYNENQHYTMTVLINLFKNFK